MALWFQRSVAYQSYPDLRLFQNGHRASRDLMEWEGLRLHILHLFHRAGACLNPYGRGFPSLDVSSPPGLFAFSSGFFRPKSTGAPPPHRSPSNPGTTEAYGFDLNENWMGDLEHHDNQKVNGWTFPSVIKSSAFTQKLDTEGCDPLLSQWQLC